MPIFVGFKVGSPKSNIVVYTFKVTMRQTVSNAYVRCSLFFCTQNEYKDLQEMPVSLRILSEIEKHEPQKVLLWNSFNQRYREDDGIKI